jgi:hypothetical protein
MTRRASTGAEAALTPRQREWLRHLRTCSRSGETMRGYAKRHGFSEHGMYQAAKGLRQRGVLPPVSRRRRSEAKRPTTFVKVSPAVSAIGSSAWRVRLPNGVVLEGTESLGSAWLEALARL